MLSRRGFFAAAVASLSAGLVPVARSQPALPKPLPTNLYVRPQRYTTGFFGYSTQGFAIGDVSRLGPINFS
jgi:hypothetical protein